MSSELVDNMPQLVLIVRCVWIACSAVRGKSLSSSMTKLLYIVLCRAAFSSTCVESFDVAATSEARTLG